MEVTGVAQAALSLQSQNLSDQIAVAVTKEALDSARQQGDAAVRLIESANLGRNIDTHA